MAPGRGIAPGKPGWLGIGMAWWEPWDEPSAMGQGGCWLLSPRDVWEIPPACSHPGRSALKTPPVILLKAKKTSKCTLGSAL